MDSGCSQWERKATMGLLHLGQHQKLAHFKSWGLKSCLEALRVWVEPVNSTFTVGWSEWTVLSGETPESVSLSLSSWAGQILQRKTLLLSVWKVRPWLSTSGGLVGRTAGVLRIQHLPILTVALFGVWFHCPQWGWCPWEQRHSVSPFPGDKSSVFSLIGKDNHTATWSWGGGLEPQFLLTQGSDNPSNFSIFITHISRGTGCFQHLSLLGILLQNLHWLSLDPIADLDWVSQVSQSFATFTSFSASNTCCLFFQCPHLYVPA